MKRSGKTGVVELPRHVHRVIKRRAGRTAISYYFYTRGRNTVHAWPSIALPDPFEPEFAERHAICAALHRDKDGFTIGGKRLPGHKDADFWQAAQKAYRAAQKRVHDERKDFTALCDAFEAVDNASWSSLSHSTRRGYQRSLRLIRDIWGDDLPADLSTPDAQEAIDALAETPATANQFRACLSRLIGWGIPRGYSKTNPVSFTEKVPGGEPWVPWPEWAFNTMVEHAPFHLLLPCVSAFFTGQRQGDVIGMRPPSKDGLIEVRAQKTKNTVWIPVHSQYRPWLERAPRGDAVQVHLGARGRPYASADGFRTEFQKLMRKPQFERFRDERIVFHGLRKNAVINLLEVGCTEAQVGAIVNMSEQMVRHYGREVSSRTLSKAGMMILESRWAEVRHQGFGTGTERELETDQQNWKPDAT